MVIDLHNIVTEADIAFAIEVYKESHDTYSEIGEVVHELKYELLPNGLYDEQTSNYLFYLVDRLKNYVEDIDLIIPAPSYFSRTSQLKLMYLLVPELSRFLEIPYDLHALKKLSPKQAKSCNLSINDYSAKVLDSQFSSSHVLIIDDLFGSGNTANFIIKLLKEKNPNIRITFISLTKNIFGGIPKNYDCYLVKEQTIRLLDNGNEILKLYFYDEFNRQQTVNIFSNNKDFAKVRDAFIDNNFNCSFDLKLSLNRSQFWTVRD